MVGPVLFQELLLGSRRNRLHVLRWCYAGWLLLELFMTLMAALPVGMYRRRPLTVLDLASVSYQYCDLLLVQHFLVLLLAVPTLTAGAVTDEKARGTLQYLLTADLRPWELLLGKLLARSWLVLSLTLPVLPMLAFFGTLGGLDLGRLLALLLATLALVFGLASASLLASALCRHTRDAVLALYALGAAIYLVARLLHGWLADAALAASLGETPQAAPTAWSRAAAVLGWFDPLHPLGADWALDDAAGIRRRLLGCVAVWGLLGLVCLALAAWRLQPAYRRYLEGLGRKPRRWWWSRRAPLRGAPIPWKERHVEGLAPLAVLRAFPRWLGLLLVVLATTVATGWAILAHLPAGPGPFWAALRSFDLAEVLAQLRSLSRRADLFYAQGFAVMLLAALVLGVRCSGAVTGERERSTWEALLLTPLPTRALIRGKFWGIVGGSLPYLIAYAVPAVALAALCGPGAVFWAVLWLAVTCLAVAYAGAAGLWCSVRSSSSWKALLGTLALIYVGGFVLWMASAIFGCVIAIIVVLFLLILEQFPGRGAVGLGLMGEPFQIGVCVALAGAFVLAAWRLLVTAEYRVSVLERTKHWKYEPEGFSRPRVRGGRRYEPRGGGRAPWRGP
jgi:ABC-type transport system involved in multi-copper enzyme maturation permease subunit